MTERGAFRRGRQLAAPDERFGHCADEQSGELCVVKHRAVGRLGDARRRDACRIAVAIDGVGSCYSVRSRDEVG